MNNETFTQAFLEELSKKFRLPVAHLTTLMKTNVSLEIQKKIAPQIEDLSASYHKTRKENRTAQINFADFLLTNVDNPFLRESAIYAYINTLFTHSKKGHLNCTVPQVVSVFRNEIKKIVKENKVNLLTLWLNAGLDKLFDFIKSQLWESVILDANIEMAKILLSYGVDINLQLQRAGMAQTPLDYINHLITTLHAETISDANQARLEKLKELRDLLVKAGALPFSSSMMPKITLQQIQKK